MGDEALLLSALFIAYFVLNNSKEDTEQDVAPPTETSPIINVIRKGAEELLPISQAAIDLQLARDALRNQKNYGTVIQTDLQKIIERAEAAKKAEKEANKQRREGRKTVYQRAKAGLAQAYNRSRITIRNVTTATIKRIKAISNNPTTGTAFRNIGLFGAVFGLVDLILDRTGTWNRIDGNNGGESSQAAQIDSDGLMAWEQDMRTWGWAECLKCNVLFRDDEDVEYDCPCGGVHTNDASKIYGVWRKPDNIPDTVTLDFMDFDAVQMCLVCGQLVNRKNSGGNNCDYGKPHSFGSTLPYSLCKLGYDNDTVDYDSIGMCRKCNSMVVVGTTESLSFPAANGKPAFRATIAGLAINPRTFQSSGENCYGGGQHDLRETARFLVVGFNQQKADSYPRRRAEELNRRIDECASRINRQRTDILHWVARSVGAPGTSGYEIREQNLRRIAEDNIADKTIIIDLVEELVSWGYISPTAEKVLLISRGFFNFNNPGSQPQNESDRIWISRDYVGREVPHTRTSSKGFEQFTSEVQSVQQVAEYFQSVHLSETFS